MLYTYFRFGFPFFIVLFYRFTSFGLPLFGATPENQPVFLQILAVINFRAHQHYLSRGR